MSTAKSDSSQERTSSSSEPTFEAYVGIKEFRNPDLPGFKGILKQRWSDFIVQEVVKFNPGEKRVAKLALKNGSALESESFPVTVHQDDFSVQGLMTDLSTVLGADDAAPALDDPAFVAFLNKCKEKADDCEEEFLTKISSGEKSIRTSLHQTFKSHASAFVETGSKAVDGKVRINLTAKHKSSKADRKEASRRTTGQWPKDLPEYLRFTMLKQNISTTAAIDFISDAVKVGDTRFQYAGVKDKRGTTTQWVTMRFGRPSMLERVTQKKHSMARNLRFGDFEYVTEPHRLGALYGNRFGLVLRELDRPDAEILQACEALKNRGFINYYGLQRFGKGEFGAKSSDVGRAIFRQDFEQATKLLFTISTNIDDQNCVDAKNAFNAGDLETAMKRIPGSMNAERSALKKLRDSPGAYEEAIGAISKGTRLMYVHAYQSLLWNRAVSERVRMGYEVLEGDLVLNRNAQGVDPSSNEVVLPEEGGDNASGKDMITEGGAADPAMDGGEEVNIQRKGVFATNVIHVVTAEDVANSRYSMRDVLMPVVGSMVQFPTNSLGKFYLDMLEADGLTLDTFSSGANQYRMSGVYRKVLQFPEDFQYAVKPYTHHDEEIVETEFQRKKDKESKPKVIMYSKAASVTPSASEGGEAKKRALCMEFTLTSGSYATMMIREITRESTDTGRQADLTSAVANSDGAGPATKKPRHE